jgi:uncharacterized protein
MPKNKIVVIYHGDCPDGFSGAWAAWKKFGNKATYIGAVDRHNPPDNLQGKEVYFIDWVYPKATMAEVMKIAKKVIALDHHETAEDATRSVTEFSYDVNHSGAVLAWQYFHPNKPVPKLLLYVEDFDLWKWKYKDTRAIQAVLDTQPQTFEKWSKLVRKVENAESRAECIKLGRTLIEYQERLIEHALTEAEPVEFEGYEVLAVNSLFFGSELGDRLSKIKPPFSIIWREGKRSIRVSLRSRNGFDVSKIAQKYGGGGHKEAAGFKIEAGEPLPWKRLPHHHHHQ